MLKTAGERETLLVEQKLAAACRPFGAAIDIRRCVRFPTRAGAGPPPGATSGRPNGVYVA